MKTVAAYLVHGNVTHERVRPVKHKFVYSLFYMRVNLAQLDKLDTSRFWFGLNKWRVVSLFTKDYGPRDGSDLQIWMRNILKDSGIQAEGEIWLQTFPRLLGFVFNPVSFWYCYDASDGLRAVLAEVNNTFGETHRYLLTAPEHQVITSDHQLHCKKAFHVSPFFQVHGHYRFKFQESDKATSVRLDYFDEKGLLLKTAIGGTCVAMTSKLLRRALLRQPWLTFKVIAAIHWEAFKLWLKRVPYFTKPPPPSHRITDSENQI